MPTDTFAITADANDGDGNKTGPVWANIATYGFNVGDGATATAFKSLFAGNYYVGCVFLRFDTSALPDDASISSASLKLYVTDKADPDAITYSADYYDFGGEASVDADWEQSSSGNCIASIDPDSLTTSTVNTIALTTLTGISVSGVTGIRIAPTNTTEPTGDNYIECAAYDHAQQEPRLEVTYTTGGGGTDATVTLTSIRATGTAASTAPPRPRPEHPYSEINLRM